MTLLPIFDWNMKQRIYITLLSLLLCFSALTAQQKAQDKYILLQGIVMDALSLDPLPNVHYVLNEILGNVTDEEGEFALYIRKDDTVRFSHIGYRDFIFVPGDTLAGNYFMAGIFMQSDTTALGEVIVVPKIPNPRTGILLDQQELAPELRNARNNIAASAYLGLHSQEQLGAPSANYELLKRKQMLDAYEKGAIPSDRMIGLNLLTIPAAVLYFSKGLPERPPPPRPAITRQEIDRMKELYRQRISKR
ncbi:MAG: hypothetical protein RQ743_01040 [Bacteroidales bacterium]|nr:hypothetical protein [Bacteroidales bacterium]